MLEITDILRSPSEAWNHKYNLIGVSLTKPVVFNIKGNDYRLVVRINYPVRIVYVRFVAKTSSTSPS